MRLFLVSFFVLISFIAPISVSAQTAISLEAVIRSVESKQIEVQVTSEGKLKNKKIKIDQLQVASQQTVKFKQGDQVIISYTKDDKGNETAYITDIIRRDALLYLSFLFIALVLVIGRWRGLFSLIGLVFSFVIIVSFIVPNIVLGNDPILISLLASFFIIPATFYLAHGFNKKTTIAVLGTCAALIVTALIAYIFVELARLTGFASEEAAFLQNVKGAINIKSLLLAGIIIGALGVLDDITISQTALVEKLINTNPKMEYAKIYKIAMDVGRDHIASLVNTLFLVYAGASLPLFLLFYQSNTSYMTVINQEIVATEIVRTLVSSIGIIMAVPLTTLLACLILKKKT